jgi:predicted metal-binding membrane protein
MIAAWASISTGAGPLLLLASLSGWLVLLGLEQRSWAATLCTVSRGALDAATIGTVAVSSLAMIVATMAPLLAQPLTYIWNRSLSRRRRRASALFVAAYVGVWIVAMVLLQAAAAGLTGIAGGWVVVLGLALLWHASPLRQIALNRCHRLPNLSTFGRRADSDCLRYGFGAGLWCVAACCAAMFVPMVLVGSHLIAMPVVATFLLLERQLPGRLLRWRLPFLLSAP